MRLLLSTQFLMKNFPLFCFLLLINTGWLEAQTATFPPFREVYEWVHQNVHCLDQKKTYLETLKILQIQKKPSGYLLLYSNKPHWGNEWQLVDTAYIWTPSKGYANALQLGTGERILYLKDYSKDAANYSSVVLLSVPKKPYEAEPFDLLPYYGYNSYKADLQDYYDQNPVKTIGDHYSSILLLEDKYINYYNTHTDALIAADADTKTALLTIHQAIEQHWTAIVEADNQLLFSGRTARTRLSHQKLLFALLYEQLGWEKAANAHFQAPDLYAPSTLQATKNYLSSCLPNSILLAHSAQSFYPLLYVQRHHHFRQDVSIIDVSKLNQTYYYEYLLDSAKGGLPKLPPYEGISNDFFTPKQNCSIEEFRLDFHKNSSTCTSIYYTIYDGTTHNISTRTNNRGLDWNSFRLATILLANAERRPVMITPYLYHTPKTALRALYDRPDFHPLCSLYEWFYKDQTLPNRYSWTSREHRQQQQWYLEKFSWKSIKTLQPIDKGPFLAFMDVLKPHLQEYIQRGQTTDATALANRIYQSYAPVFSELSIRHRISYIRYFYQLELRQEADVLYGALLQDLIAKKHHNEPTLDKQYHQYYTSYSDKKNYVPSLKNLIKEHKIQAHEDLFKTYSARWESSDAAIPELEPAMILEDSSSD